MLSSSTLPPFPSAHAHVPVGHLLDRHAPVTLVDAQDTHLPWLCALYRQSRWHEVEMTGWDPHMGVTFLDQQFSLQHRHYVRYFVNARFLIVLRDGAPCGRLYVDLSPERHHLIDILLEASCRGSGIGSSLLRALQVSAGVHGCPLELSVQHDNQRAYQLYRRLGFLDINDTSTHRLMRWTSPQVS